MENTEKLLRDDVIIENILSHKEFIGEVAEWIHDEFDKGDPNRTLEYVIQRLKNRQMEQEPMSFVALVNGQCAGVISIFENDLVTKPSLKPWLGGLYVNEKFRGKGIGQMLMNKVMEVCRELGREKVYLRTENADGYYLNRGWEFIQDAVDVDGEATKVYAMKL